MRKLWTAFPLLSLLGAQCGTLGPCTVTRDAPSGVATIRCPDGTSVEVAPGADGLSPTVTAVGPQGDNGQCVGTGGVKIQLGTAPALYVCNGAPGSTDGGTAGGTAPLR
jgi:hypothetical protein